MAWHEPNLDSPISWMKTILFSQIFSLLLLMAAPIAAVFVMDVTGVLGITNSTECVMWYFGGGIIALFMVGGVLFVVEMNHSAYYAWQYWQQNEIYHWVIPKHTPIYLLESAVVSNNPFVIEHINGDKPLPRDENLPALLPNSDTVISGSDRLILLFSILLEKLSVPSAQDGAVSHIYVNTAVEVDEFTKLTLKTILSASPYSQYKHLSFCCQPDYNQQVEEIKSQKEFALVFTLLHYSTESQEENEMGSVLLLSPQYEDNAIGLFPAMPFSMENHEEDIDQLLRVQQQPNTSLKLLCTSESEIIETDKIHQCLVQKELNLLAERVHSGTLNFSDIVGEHGDLSIYLLLATLPLSHYQQDSVLVFYRVNEKVYCQSVGKQPSVREGNISSNKPELALPTGSCFLGFAALLGVFFIGILLGLHVNNMIFLTAVAVLTLFMVSIGLMIINQIYINQRWWPVFLSRCR
ncbi:hypothetical protein [Providencia stuartii]|uniref:hypothetical protein n=1 Tax=Providencia stuartii TaxID=588 RepID=UPI00331BAB06